MRYTLLSMTDSMFMKILPSVWLCYLAMINNTQHIPAVVSHTHLISEAERKPLIFLIDFFVVKSFFYVVFLKQKQHKRFAPAAITCL